RFRGRAEIPSLAGLRPVSGRRSETVLEWTTIPVSAPRIASEILFQGREGIRSRRIARRWAGPIQGILPDMHGSHFHAWRNRRRVRSNPVVLPVAVLL